MNKNQSKLAKEAKRIKRETGLNWSVCKWAAKKKMKGLFNNVYRNNRFDR